MKTLEVPMPLVDNRKIHFDRWIVGNIFDKKKSCSCESLFKHNTNCKYYEK